MQKTIGLHSKIIRFSIYHVKKGEGLFRKESVKNLCKSDKLSVNYFTYLFKAFCMIVFPNLHFLKFFSFKKPCISRDFCTFSKAEKKKF